MNWLLGMIRAFRFDPLGVERRAASARPSGAFLFTGIVVLALVLIETAIAFMLHGKVVIPGVLAIICLLCAPLFGSLLWIVGTVSIERGFQLIEQEEEIKRLQANLNSKRET